MAQSIDRLVELYKISLDDALTTNPNLNEPLPSRKHMLQVRVLRFQQNSIRHRPSLNFKILRLD